MPAMFAVTTSMLGIDTGFGCHRRHKRQSCSSAASRVELDPDGVPVTVTEAIQSHLRSSIHRRRRCGGILDEMSSRLRTIAGEG